MKTSSRFLVLTLWFLLVAGIYWGLGNSAYTILVTSIFFVLCFLFTVLYLLVNGGVDPCPKPEGIEAEPRKKHLHPIKEKARRRAETERKNAALKASPATPRINPLRLSPQRQYFLSRLLLVLVLPLYVIFLVDWVLLYFGLI